MLQDLGWWKSADWICLALPISLIMWAFSAGLIKRSTRALLYIEASTVALILVLLVVILVKVGQGHGLNGGTLTGSIFTLPPGVNVHALILGSVFGFLAFAGFEGAGALGEEAQNPQKAIPRAIGLVGRRAGRLLHRRASPCSRSGFGATTPRARPRSRARAARCSSSPTCTWAARCRT